MNQILAVDQGTSGTKALLLSESGEIIGRGYQDFQLVHGQNGLVEVDAHVLWNSILSAIDQLKLRDAPIAMGLANQGESVLVWDRKTGVPLSPVMVWQDSRAASLCDERREFESLVKAQTGLTLDPYFIAPKMKFLRDRYSDGVITTTDTWIIYRLTGKYVTDHGTASRSLIYDLQTNQWSKELLSIWNLEREELPEIYCNDDVVAPINAPELPQLHSTLLAGINVDQPAALFAQSCFKPGEAKCTYGTGAFLLANIGDQPKISHNGLVTSVAWFLKSEKAYYFDGQVFTAASAITWLIENGLLDSSEQIDSLPSDTGGVIAVPGFAGYGSPRWQPEGTASITGISLGTTKAHIARAVVDGIAAQVSELLDALAADGVLISRLRADGGLSQSRTLMQTQSNLSQIPIDVYPHPDATALGIAGFTRLALDSSLSPNEAIPKWQAHESYTPSMSSESAKEFMKRWQAAADLQVGEM
jgi:glycerol kinase